MLKNYTLFESTDMVQISNLIALGLQNYVEIFISDCCNFLFISVKINKSPRYKFYVFDTISSRLHTTGYM